LNLADAELLAAGREQFADELVVGQFSSMLV